MQILLDAIWNGCMIWNSSSLLRISHLLRSLRFARLADYHIAASVYDTGAGERNHTRLRSVRVIHLAQPLGCVPPWGFPGPEIPTLYLRLAHVLRRHTQHIGYGRTPSSKQIRDMVHTRAATSRTSAATWITSPGWSIKPKLSSPRGPCRTSQIFFSNGPL